MQVSDTLHCSQQLWFCWFFFFLIQNIQLAHNLCETFYSQCILEVLKLNKGTLKPKLPAHAFLLSVFFHGSLYVHSLCGSQIAKPETAFIFHLMLPLSSSVTWDLFGQQNCLQLFGLLYLLDRTPIINCSYWLQLFCLFFLNTGRTVYAVSVHTHQERLLVLGSACKQAVLWSANRFVGWELKATWKNFFFSPSGEWNNMR